MWHISWNSRWVKKQVRSSTGNVPLARRFLFVFSASALLCLAAAAALNLYYNPWGNYGNKGVSRLYNARRAKSEYLAELHDSLLPDAIVVGSSNTMRFSPSTIKELSGLQAFNCGVFWGRTDDMLCWWDFFAEDLKHTPKLVIAGIDHWSMVQPPASHPVFPLMRRRMLNAPLLRKHHPQYNPILHGWSQFIDLFNFQQARSSFGMLRHGRSRAESGSLKDTPGFTTEGTRLYYRGQFGGTTNIFEAVEKGTYDITHRLKVNSARQGERSIISRGASSFTYEGLDSLYVKSLLSLVKKCDEAGSQLLLVLLPTHPLFREAIATTVEYRNNRRDVMSVLAQASRTSDRVRVYDAEKIEDYSADPNGFYDVQHPATRVCDRILEEALMPKTTIKETPPKPADPS